MLILNRFIYKKKLKNEISSRNQCCSNVLNIMTIEMNF